MKIGDRVRVVKPGPFVPPAAWGQVGEIIGINATFPDLYEVVGPWLPPYFKSTLLGEEELELVQEAEHESTNVL